jgi:hypothetical protein
MTVFPKEFASSTNGPLSMAMLNHRRVNIFTLPLPSYVTYCIFAKSGLIWDMGGSINGILKWMVSMENPNLKWIIQVVTPHFFRNLHGWSMNCLRLWGESTNLLGPDPVVHLLCYPFLRWSDSTGSIGDDFLKKIFYHLVMTNIAMERSTIFNG